MRSSLATIFCLSAAACGTPAPAVAPTTLLTLAPATSQTVAPRASACPTDQPAPTPERSAQAPRLPPLPSIADVPGRNGEAFTVRGALHAFRNPGELAALSPDEIVVEGVVIDENVSRAPTCALHPVTKADPKGCSPEIPTFWLADDERPGSERIRVLGWASRFAEIFEARRLAHATPPGQTAKRRQDDRWGQDIPWPLPAKGQRVRVRGTYSAFFEKISGAIQSDPRNGILSFKRLDPL